MDFFKKIIQDVFSGLVVAILIAVLTWFHKKRRSRYFKKKCLISKYKNSWSTFA